MRFILLLVSLNIFNQTQVHSQANQSLCDYINRVIHYDNGIFFSGTQIATVPHSQSFEYRQYSIEEIFQGEVFNIEKEDSDESEFENTDSTIWVLINIDKLENPDVEKALFVLQKPSYSGTYRVYNNHSHYEISDGGIIEGNIFDSNFENTLEVEEFKELVIDECLLSKTQFADILENESIIYPNPSSHYINLSLPYGISQYDFEVELYDKTGRYFGLKIEDFSVFNPDGIIYPGQMPTGHYIIRFVSDQYQFAKNIIIEN